MRPMNPNGSLLLLPPAKRGNHGKPLMPRLAGDEIIIALEPGMGRKRLLLLPFRAGCSPKIESPGNSTLLQYALSSEYLHQAGAVPGREPGSRAHGPANLMSAGQQPGIERYLIDNCPVHGQAGNEALEGRRQDGKAHNPQ